MIQSSVFEALMDMIRRMQYNQRFSIGVCLKESVARILNIQLFHNHP